MPIKSRLFVCLISVSLALMSPLLRAAEAEKEYASVQAFLQSQNYDASIPRLKTVVGHDHGEKISAPDEIVTYFKALAAAAPQRTRLVTYARSWEGRPLLYLVVSSKENIARLDQIQNNMQRVI